MARQTNLDSRGFCLKILKSETEEEVVEQGKFDMVGTGVLQFAGKICQVFTRCFQPRK